MASGQDDKSFQETRDSTLKDDTEKEAEEQQTEKAKCEITPEDEHLLTDNEKQVALLVSS